MDQMAAEGNEFVNDHEIDVCELWRIVWKRRSVVIIVTLLFLAGAGLFIALSREVYKVSNALVLSKIGNVQLSYPEVKMIIQVLDDLPPSQQAKELGMEVGAIKNVKRIKAVDIKGSNIVKLEIETLNRETGMGVMQILPRYIMTRPYVVKMIEREKGLLNSNIHALKKIIDDPSIRLRLATSHTIIFSPMMDIYSCNEKYNQLIADLDKIEKRELVFFVRQTIFPIEPYKPKKILVLTIGLLGGIIIGAFMALVMEWAIWQKSVHIK